MMRNAAAVLVTVLFLSISTPAQIVPAGFLEQPLATGFMLPTGVAGLPDGRYLVAEQISGDVHVVTTGGTIGLLGSVPQLGIIAQEGLLGLAVDPQWPTRPFVYTLFGHGPSSSMWITRWQVTGSLTDGASTNIAFGDRYDVITDIPDVMDHGGGTLRFGPDGMLYVSLGDDQDQCAAQDPSIHGGCILRLDVSGLPLGAGGPPAKSALVPTGNPFSGPDDNARLVYAQGLRNPFRFHIDDHTGDIFIGDVGGNAYEEINSVTAPGQNFGWPWYEGPAATPVQCPIAVPPIEPAIALIDRATTVGPSAVVSVCAYRNAAGAANAFGPTYEGSYFYTDYFTGAITRLEWNGLQWGTAPPVAGQPSSDHWASGIFHITDSIQAPDGSIVYVRRIEGDLRQIRPDPTAPNLTVVSGNHQIGNSLLPLPQPLVVRLTDPSGQPIAGTTVSFSESTNVGTFNPPTAVTDAAGLASTNYTLGLLPPSIVASAPGASAATFDIVWRGVVGVSGLQFGQPFIGVWVFHSQVNSPFTLVFEPPTISDPVSLSAGAIWTTIQNPGPYLLAYDGLGLLGSPNPLYRTESAVPVWSTTYWNPPPVLTGFVLISQAFALDLTLSFPQNIMISNPVFIAFP